MANPKISVIVPVYNVEKYINRCLDSLLAQSYQNLQIILVDDGSQDRSASICDEYATLDNRITVIHKENGGLSSARNAGLRIADGEYIGYVDSDDWIEPDMYYMMINAILDNGAQLAACRYKQVTPDRTIDNGSPDIVCLTRDELLDIYVNEHPKYIIYNSVWSKLYSRELVKDLIFPEGRNSEDIVYTTTAFCRLDRAVYIDKGLYNYVTGRPDSIMNDAKSKKRCLEDEIPFLRQQIQIYRDNGLEDIASQATYMFYVRLMSYYVRFRRNRATEYASAIAKIFADERDSVLQSLKCGKATKGYAMRMRIMLASPGLYYRIEKIYEDVLVPLRTRHE